MSRIAKTPVPIPEGVTVTIEGQAVQVKGPKATLFWRVHPAVSVVQESGALRIMPNQENRDSWAQAGTTRALLNNMVVGCTRGFEKKMSLVGVGYRAQVQGNTLNLNLGFSHPVHYSIPEDIQITTPSPTEIVVAGSDKQRVGQVAAEIRNFRPPEPYKGKGIRYADEYVARKEAKKKAK